MGHRLQLTNRWILIILFWLTPALSSHGAANDGWISADAGELISEIIDRLRGNGFPIAYSTALVPADLLVLEQAEAAEPLALVEKILQPHGLTLRATATLHIVTRASRDPSPVTTKSALAEVTADGPSPQAIPLPEVIVSGSRYQILRELLGASSLITQRTIQQLPDFGEDPIRAVQRLPGTAAGGISAKSYIRGGEQNETDIILNGQRLLDPFHVRDFQSPFSAIDARAIDGIEVFTGGFPVKYGDRMGGMILIDTLTPSKPLQTEIGVSVFNTSLLSAGTAADGDVEWVLSARRGNLDLILNKNLGKPSYYDIFAEIELDLSPRTRLSANGLLIEDRVLVVTESDLSEREESKNETQNAYFWINWDQQWTNWLQSNTTLSTNSFSSERTGQINDPVSIIGQVDDQRSVNIAGIRQDWIYDVTENHRLLFGAEFRSLDANYNYSSAVDYFGLIRSFATAPPSNERDLAIHVDGRSIALYFSDRWQLARKTVAEAGIRWDKQTYTNTARETQVSPRFSILHALGRNTTLRASWGRFYQSQGIYELQIEDGITEFFPAQRSDQTILGLQHRFRDHYSFRIEAYWKSMSQLRPRFENLFDPLAVMPEIKPDRVRISPEKAYARGLEFSLAYETDEAFSWWATYTRAEVEDQINGVEVPRSWDQKYAMQVGLAWSNDRWDIGLAMNHRSGWPKTSVSIDTASDPLLPTVTAGERNTERFGRFTTIDMRISYKKPVAIGTLSMYFELSNALNRSNPCCIDFELIEDNQGNVTIEQEDDSWFPRLPAIGFLWEF